MKTRLQSNEEAKALAGRLITEVDLGIIEEVGDDYSGSPTIRLDDGSVLSFEVDDFGSGTYGVNIEVDRPKASDTRAVQLPERLLARLAACAERGGTDVETLAARWLAEREDDEMGRRMLEAAGANKADPTVVYETTCAVTMFDLRIQLSSDGLDRGLWIFLRDHSPERERQHAHVPDYDRNNPRFNGGRLDEGGLLEWPAAKAFHAAMGKVLRGRPR